MIVVSSIENIYNTRQYEQIMTTEEKHRGTNHFNEVAETFEDKPIAKTISSNVFSHVKKILEKESVQPKTLRVLDFGCGTGILAPLFEPFIKIYDGVDLSSGMIKQLEKKIQNQLDSRFSAHCIDLFEQPLYESEQPTIYKKYDLIVISLVLHHVPDARQTVINLCTRHLAEGGRIIIFDIFHDSHNPSQHQFHEHAQAHSKHDLGVHHGHGFSEEFMRNIISGELNLEFSIEAKAFTIEEPSWGPESHPVFCVVGKK